MGVFICMGRFYVHIYVTGGVKNVVGMSEHVCLFECAGVPVRA